VHGLAPRFHPAHGRIAAIAVSAAVPPTVTGYPVPTRKQATEQQKRSSGSSVMIVTCPSCSTRYELPESSVAGQGRTVRCARCGNQWFLTNPALHARQDAPARAAKPQAEMPSEESVAAIDDEMQSALAEPEPAIAAKPKPVKTAPAQEESEASEAPAAADDEEDPWERRRRRAFDELPSAVNQSPSMPDAAATGGSSMRKVAGWAFFLLLIAGTVATGHFGRMEIVEALPQAQPIYEAAGYRFPTPLDGLDLPEVKSSRSLENGTPVLIVEGKVTNSSQESKKLPEMKAELLDKDGRPVGEWFFKIDLGVVAPGGEAPFREVYLDPDPSAVNVSVSFVGGESTGGAADPHDAGREVSHGTPAH